MLIKCPECNREISSAAACCPGCGYPINTPPKPKKQSKKKGGGSKLPNGYGSVYKLSGNRRKPWVAAKTFGWILDEEKGTAKQVQRPIGYFPTKSEPWTRWRTITKILTILTYTISLLKKFIINGLPNTSPPLRVSPAPAP